MPTHYRISRFRSLTRLLPVAILTPLTFTLAGCHQPAKESCETDCCAMDTKSTKPTWTHGGVMANDTNKPFVPKASSGTLGTIERLDPRLDKLIAPDAKVEKLVEGLDWAEGPVWDKANKCLYFSDVPQNVVYKWQEGKGISEYIRPSGYTGTAPRGGEPGSNGLTIDAGGNLALCQHGDRRVARYDAAKKTMSSIADKFEGKRFSSPNDLCFDSKGNLFFTDPPYGLVKNMEDSAKEIPFQGVYRVSTDGKLTLLTKELSRPNGLALSPDEKTLYVANSDPKMAIWKAFPLKDDGTLGEGKVFFDATSTTAGKKGLPDGMKIDKDGNLFATGPGGVLIFAADGTHLGTLATGEATANCAWGDDGSTLYICADMYLARIKTKTEGK